MNTAIIIPTGDRPKCLALCFHYLLRQTIWKEPGTTRVILVDDGHTPSDVRCLGESIPLTYVRRVPKENDPPHTLPCNILEAMKHLTPTDDCIVFFEDDEWYSPHYVGTLVSLMRQVGSALAGQVNSVYYRFPERCSHENHNRHHASLCATGLTRELFPVLESVCDYCVTEGQPFVDLHLWGRAPVGSRWYTNQLLHVGMKGLPGRRGTTSGWTGTNLHEYFPDADLAFLRHLIGDDVVHYEKEAPLWQ